jgi:hypothetical protein
MQAWFYKVNSSETTLIYPENKEILSHGEILFLNDNEIKKYPKLKEWFYSSLLLCVNKDEKCLIKFNNSLTSKLATLWNNIANSGQLFSKDRKIEFNELHDIFKKQEYNLNKYKDLLQEVNDFIGSLNIKN